MRVQLARKSPQAAKPAICATRARSSASSGSVVRLRVVEVLQAVLDVAQEDVGGGELAAPPARAAGSSLASSASTCSVGRTVQRRIAPAADQLQRLGDELDLADAARAELDVLGELAPRDLAPHFGVQRGASPPSVP